MYICMTICIYVHMYECMHTFFSVLSTLPVSPGIGGYIYICIVCSYACMNACMNVCIYIYACTYVHVHIMYMRKKVVNACEEVNSEAGEPALSSEHTSQVYVDAI